MAKKKKQQKREGHSETVTEKGPPTRNTAPDWPVVALSLLGALLAGYLTLTAWLDAAPAFCAEGSSCEIVQGSRWGTLLGIPTSFLGLLTYLALGHFAYRERRPGRRWSVLWVLSLVGLAYSLYLTGVSYFVIQAFCVYCVISMVIMATIFVLVAARRPAMAEQFSWPAWASQTGVVALLIVGALHLHYSGVFDAAAGPEDPYVQGLAQHLSDSGAIFYGAYW